MHQFREHAVTLCCNDYEHWLCWNVFPCNKINDKSSRNTMGHFNFWLSLSLSDSLSETLSCTLKSGLRPNFNLTLDLDFGWAGSDSTPALPFSEFAGLVGIKLLFRQPIWQVHVFHWSSRSSTQFCISAPHSSLCNCSSSNPRHVLCLCDA